MTLVAPTPSSIQPSFPSLMQAILYCDTKGVELILDALRKESGTLNDLKGLSITALFFMEVS